MAKVTNIAAQYFQFGLLAFYHDFVNKYVRLDRRSSEEQKKLTKSLAINGWQDEKGMITSIDARSPLFKSDPQWAAILEKEYQNRKDRYTKLKSDPNLAIELSVFKELHCDDKGEVLRPTMIPLTCNGRGEAFENAMVLRARGIVDTVDKDTGTDYSVPPQSVVSRVPVRLIMVNSLREMIEIQLDENGKQYGFVEPSPKDRTRTVYTLVNELGATQADIRRRFPGSFGQTRFLFVRLDALWSDTNRNELFPGEKSRPNLDLYHRAVDLTSKSGKDRFIPVSLINDTVAMTELVTRSSPELLKRRNDRVARENTERRSGERQGEDEPLWKPATAEDIEQYFREGRSTSKGKGKAKDGLGNDVWETYKGGKNLRMQDIAEAQLSGSVEKIASLMQHTDVDNEVYRLLAAGKKSEVLMALQCISHPTFGQYAEGVLSGKDVEIVVKTPEANPVVV